MEPLEFVGLIASRIFHDFAGPIGAIVNGTELLADEPDPNVRREFTSILGGAANQLAARLRIYRLIFGTGDLADFVAIDDARAALTDWLLAETRVMLDWLIPHDRLSRGIAKLVLGLAVLGVEALPRGGTLTVTSLGQTWTVKATGVRAALTADVLAALNDSPGVEIGSRGALARYVQAVAERSNLVVSIRSDERTVVLTVADRGMSSLPR